MFCDLLLGLFIAMVARKIYNMGVNANYFVSVEIGYTNP